MLFRFWYGIKIKLGLLRRRTPLRKWRDKPLRKYLSDQNLAGPASYADYRRCGRTCFFFKSLNSRPNPPKGDTVDSASTEAENVLNGTFSWFREHKYPAGLPPDWFTDPFSHASAPHGEHWSRIPESGDYDIKSIWELSRFGFTFALVRAYSSSGDDNYAGVFWRLVEDWYLKNPPNHGPNWKCGQEVAFRVMAWCFGLYGFAESQETTPQRVVKLAHMIAVSGERIEANIGYALSQNNNHGISEAMGLFTIGLLFPEFRQSARWREKGHRLLEKLAVKLFYDDGTFAQHAMIYHRLALQDYIWAVRLGALNGVEFCPAVRKRLLTAVGFLYDLLDPQTGRVPNYGHNDGSLILPLNNCDYLDFRPVVQAGFYLFTGQKVLPVGAWDEDLWWLFGKEAMAAPVFPRAKKNLSADVGGYYTLHTRQSTLFFRCGGYKHRPHQADMLHTDIFWRGENIALDPGSYSYHAPDPWDNSLTATRYHNTVTVDGCDQMRRAGKFMFLPWTHAFVTKQASSPQMCGCKLLLKRYGRLNPAVTHQRTIIQLPEDVWIVLDRMECSIHRVYTLHWLLMDAPFQQEGEIVILKTPEGSCFFGMSALNTDAQISVIRGDAGSPRGWWSPNYYVKKPALSAALVVKECQAVFISIFSPHMFTLTKDDYLCITTAEWRAEILTESRPMFIHLTGKYGDTLKI